MSIHDAIARLEEIELFAVTTSWEGEETPRYAYVSSEVAKFLWEPDENDKRLSKRSKGLVDDFVEGGHITVGWRPHDKADCIMARVESPDPSYEIWDFRCIAPKPGVRILGGFAEKDTFLCITWDYRENFEPESPGEESRWPAKIEECINEWRRLLGNEKPFKGRSVNEYLSKPWEVV